MLLPGAFELFKRLRDDDPRRDAHLLANYILTEVYTFLKEQKLLYTDLPIEPDFVGQCVDLLQADEITEGVAFDLLHLRMSGDLRTACEIVAEHKWTKAAEREVIDRLVREAIAFEPYYSSIYAKKAKSFALNQILLRLDVIGRKTVSRQTAKRVIDQLLRNSNNDSTNNSDRPAD